MYDNPEDYIDDEKQKEQKRKRWSIDKALDLAEKRKTKQEKTDMDAEQVVDAAEMFEEFLEDSKNQ